MVDRSPLDFTPQTLVELLRWRALDNPHHLAFTFLEDGETQEITLTYGALDRRARVIGESLQGLGVEGQRALLLYPPGLDYIAAFFGCLYAGVMAVPAYPPRLNRPVPRIQAIVADSQAKIALTTTSILENIENRFEHTPDLAAMAWLDTERLPIDREPEWQDPGITPDHLAFLQYTSGSTSVPKGVMLSHGNLIHNLNIIKHGFQIDEHAKGVFWLPSYHDMGLIGGILEPIFVNGPSTLLSPVSFLQRPIRWLQAISRYRGTISGAPNFAYELCVKSTTPEERAGLDLSSWTTAFCGAEPIRAETLEQFAEAFAPHGFRRDAFYPCYGLAEGTLLVSGGEGAGVPQVHVVQKDALKENRVVTANQPGEDSQTLVGSGGGLPGQRILIVDPQTGMPCQPDQVGEIWVSGPSVAQGYWGRPEETERAFRAYLADSGEGPFLRTGDLGFLQEGELFITGRLKDLIIIRGRNYYPQDIEQTVEGAHYALESISGAAFSVEADGQERLVVVHELARKHRNTAPEEVFAAVRRAIAEQHGLQVYAVVLLKPRSIPMTSSGKVKRHACKMDFLDGSLQTVAAWRAGSPGEFHGAAPQPALVGFEDPQPGRSGEEIQAERAIQAWLIDQVATRVGLATAQVDPREPFTYFGLDSVQAVGLAGDLEIWLGRSLSPTLAWDYPSIDSLARHLAGEARPQPARSAAPTARSFQDPIAVVGLGCRFPGAPDPNAFWQLLQAGVDAIREVPPDRWQVDDFYQPDAATPGKANTRWGGFLEDVASFDPHFFGISPREAARMDPQQRLLLEVAWEALEHAGQAPDQLAGGRTGVFVGISSYDYSRIQFGDPEGIDAYAGTGNAHSIAANRLSYSLDLRGPSIAVDTACSSSLVAVHLAIQSLRLGESDLALAGGVNLILSPELTITFSQARMLAADGRCKTFDARADGYVRGEGCGVVVLKRLADALRDGDNILALLRGSAVNQDGRSNGLTAPNGPSQQAVIREALADAGVQPAQIGYLEAHGTGTPLGDPIEIQSLRAVLEADRPPDRPLAVGSVKTNIGHLEAAAGIAGLIKVVLSLGHEQIPPHLHLQELNPHIALEGSALEIVTGRRPWPRGSAPRVAGVSSFGFGGTNAHVVVAEAPALEALPSPPAGEVERRLQLLTLSAKSEASLRGLAARYQQRLAELPADSLAQVCHSANNSRARFDHRLAVIAENSEQMKARLAAYREGQQADLVLEGMVRTAAQPRVAFLFTGQGAQFAGMGRRLYETQPVFQRTLDRCAEILAPMLDRPLLMVIYPPAGESTPLDQTAYTQPALFAIEYALAQMWLSWGIEPVAVMGHSLGELVAACVAGVFSLEDGLQLVAERGRLIQGLAVPGTMAAVFAGRSHVEARLPAYEHRLDIAALNAPENVVISGDEQALVALLADLEAEGILARPLTVSHAFHSNLMEPILDDFERLAGQLSLHSPQIPLVSNVTGEIWGPDEVPDAGYWRRHVREPVHFAAGMQTLTGLGVDIFLEIGPQPVLSGLGRRCLAGERLTDPDGAPVFLASLRQGSDDWQEIMQSLGALYVRGAGVDWAAYEGGAKRQKVALPTYPFDRQPYWLEANASPARPAAAGLGARHPSLGQRLHTPLPIYETRLPQGSAPEMEASLREMMSAAAGDWFGPGSHQLKEWAFLESPVRDGPPVTVQTLVSPRAEDHISVEIYREPQGQAPWTLLARGQISRGEAAQETLQSGGAGEEERPPDGSTLRDQVLAAVPDGRPALIAAHLREQVGEVLGLDPARVEGHQPLDRLGLDSLMAMELKNRLESGLGVVIPVVNLLEGPTLATLGSQVIDQLNAPSRDLGPPLTPAADRDGDHPLAYNQQSLWFLQQLVPEGVSFNVSGAVRVYGELNPAYLERAVQKLMARHAILRTTFSVEDGLPVQRVHEYLPAPFAVIDASHWDEQEMDQYLSQKAHQPFDLAHAPAFRVEVLVRTAEHRSNGKDAAAVVLLAMDHMISDFWSISVLVQEALLFYQEAATGDPAPLPPLDLQYTDYVHWQREMLAGPTGERLLDYWRSQLNPGRPALDLPTDRPRPPMQTFRGDSLSLQLSPGMSAGLKDLASAHNATLYMTLLAAFQVLLHRLSGQDDLTVGSVTAGRSQPGLAGLVGYLINPLAMRADLSGNPTFRQFLAQVRQTVLAAIEHQDCPPALLAEHLALPRDPSRPPLFETMFILQKAQLAELADLGSFALGLGGTRLEAGGLVLESQPLSGHPAQFDLTLMMAEVGERLGATLHFNTDLFKGETAARMLAHFETLLAGILADPDQPIGTIPLLTESERRDLLVGWNATGLDLPLVAGAHQLVEAQAARTPEAVAVKYEGESLTYQALNCQANQVAHHLQSLGVGPGTLVGIYLERSLDMVVCLLGVLKAGGAYVPLDPEFPQERLVLMLEDSRPLVVLTQEQLIPTLPPGEARVVSVDGEWERISQAGDEDPLSGITSDDLAYVIYTSGSTGVPKGVQIPHRAMINFLLAMQAQPGLGADDVLLAVTTLSFDIAVLELFLPLTVGACVEVASQAVASDGARLVEKLAASGATLMQATPATWRMMLEAGWGTAPHEAAAPNGAGLTILCGGEALPRDLAQALLDRSRVVWNMYGPTETTVWSTMARVRPGTGAVPIGRPIANTQVYVLDSALQPVPVGVVGELYIGGEGVARGYRNRVELTAERFIQDPFRAEPGARLYRTGDLARQDRDGNLMFLGRQDHQVKVRGFRIELGDIEAALVKHDAIRQAVALAWESIPGDVQLVAYNVLDTDAPEPTVGDLRSFLRRWLPDYMLPAAFITLEALPLTPNGKVDRRSLPEPALERPLLGEDYVAPRNQQEQDLAAISAGILGIEQVGIHDDFFELGGNSLSATRLLFQVQERFQVRLPLIKVFESPTIAGLSAAIDLARQAPQAGAVLFGTTSLDELRQESQLEASIAANSLRYEPVAEPDHIFLTGATGFVGAFLLHGLLNNTGATIHCLVRAPDRTRATERLKANMGVYSLWEDGFQERVIALPGDLAQPWLGLSSDRVGFLSRAVDLIYHNGAMVNLVYPYQSHKPANVGGTIEVLRLAAHQRIKPVHFVSSISVLHTPAAHLEVTIAEDTALEDHGVPLGGYAQSKWVGERLVQQAGERGIPISVFRPGPISGHSQDGRWNQDDLMFSLLSAAVELGSAPDLDLVLDIVPVDYVAEAIVHISRQLDALGKVYHLTAAEQVHYRDLLKGITDEGFPIYTVPFEQWKRDLFELAARDPQNGWQVYLPLIAEVDAHVLRFPRFGQENTRAGLAGTSIQSKPLGLELLRTYFRHFIDSGKLPIPTAGVRPG